KIKMTSFIQSLDYDLWDVVVIGPELPNSKIGYDENERELLKLNAKVKHIIFCSLNSNIFESISLCNSVKEIWNKLEECYGTSSCLMSLEESGSESDEEDSSKGGNEVSNDDFVEVVDRYTSIISSLKTKIKSLTIENNDLKMNNSLMNDNASEKDEIAFLKNEVNRLSKENDTLRNELHIVNMSLELSTSVKDENEKLKIEVDVVKKTFSKSSNSSHKLDRLLGVQRCVFNRVGLGFDEMNKVVHFKILVDRKKDDNVVKKKINNVSCNVCGKIGHVSSKCWYRHRKHLISCNFCGKNGHTSSFCWHKNYSVKIKRIWVLKGTF
ncbi:zf-CCHC domain-containing protein, partial [Cephalotus follicularis]